MLPAWPVDRYVCRYTEGARRPTECHRLARWIVTLLAMPSHVASRERETPPGKPVASQRSAVVGCSNERNDPQGKPGAFPDTLPVFQPPPVAHTFSEVERRSASGKNVFRLRPSEVGLRRYPAVSRPRDWHDRRSPGITPDHKTHPFPCRNIGVQRYVIPPKGGTTSGCRATPSLTIVTALTADLGSGYHSIAEIVRSRFPCLGDSTVTIIRCQRR